MAKERKFMIDSPGATFNLIAEDSRLIKLLEAVEKIGRKEAGIFQINYSGDNGYIRMEKPDERYYGLICSELDRKEFK